MSEKIEIRLIIKPSLVKYFEEGMKKRHIAVTTAEEITGFLEMVLNDSSYPMFSSKTDEQEISLSYRAKSFADPIF